MSEKVPEGQALTQLVLRKLKQGYNLNQTAAQLGIDPSEASAVWNEYLDNKLSMGFDAQYILHLERLEELLVTSQDVLLSDMDSDSLEARLKILDRIEDMQSLALSRKEKAKSDEITLTKQQVGIMFQVFTEMQAAWKTQLEIALGKPTIKAIKGELLDDFDGTFKEIQRNALGALNEQA